MLSDQARFLRETTGTSAVAETARAVAAALQRHGIPHFIAGGLAVQEHGYPRVTVDVDIIVPDRAKASQLLTADASGHFVPGPEGQDKLLDKRNGVMIDLLPAGQVLKEGCTVPFPAPILASEQPQFVTLVQIISLKLDSWANSPLRRHRDKSDVVELILRRALARDLAVNESVEELYLDTWDGLQAET